MRSAIIALALGGGLLGAAQLHAQAVQLPTFNFFTVDTTVSVPDVGAAFLGGTSRAASGSTEYGTPLAGKLPVAGRLFRNEAIASSMGTSRAAVSARVIDLEEMDRAVLGAAAAERAARGLPGGGVDPQLARKAEFLARNLGRPEADATPAATPPGTAPSVAELAEQRVTAARQRASEAAEYFAKAQDLEAAGKPGVAKIYYQMAAARATGELRIAAQARFAALNSSGNVARGE